MNFKRSLRTEILQLIKWERLYLVKESKIKDWLKLLMNLRMSICVQRLWARNILFKSQGN